VKIFAVAISSVLPAPSSEVRHYHAKARQFFFVLSGTATIEINGKRETLQKHEGAQVAPGVPHRMFNECEREVEFLVVSQPASRGDRYLAEDRTLKTFRDFRQ
jgi:mannose-6-phosphate isomerase-like protein (cupin superfamily)